SRPTRTSICCCCRTGITDSATRRTWCAAAGITSSATCKAPSRLKDTNSAPRRRCGNPRTSSARMDRRPLLTAEWRWLAMLTYAIDAECIADLVPRGTELDRFDGKTYVSLVGFRFLKTRVRGVLIPFHANFDEVNLRFYVRRQDKSGPRRGVVFVREVVPRF